MSKGRLEAFSDGLFAVIITIMVLELKVPHGADLRALEEVGVTFIAYVLSFAYLAIYWNNHHHMLHVTHRINGKILWANMHMLFWLSLVPFTTAWMGEHSHDAVPTALYGCVLFLSGGAYLILQTCIIADQGDDSELKAAVGFDLKGKASAVLYLSAIGVALARPRIAQIMYAVVALMWAIPDRRIEEKVEEKVEEQEKQDHQSA